MTSNKKTNFNDQWLEVKLNPQFIRWLGKGPDSSKAYSKVCKKTFDLSNMGRQAEVSHSREETHLNLIKTQQDQPSLKNFFVVCSNNTNISESVCTENYAIPSTSNHTQPIVNDPECSINNQPKPVYQSVSSFCIKDDVTRSEILWALKVLDDKMSLNSCADIGETFKLMFPDSAVASNFKMGPMKCKYVINYGPAPYISRKQKHNTLYFAMKLILP